ncbi:MAG TPA: glycosyltransferase N-terminal domain-containing protein [Pseudobdellovibrionaceae bacterium]|nr:glycosyltransferase N-terminal domain-containing protein [Pseudobdellovibrionaceae bacterium]
MSDRWLLHLYWGLSFIAQALLCVLSAVLKFLRMLGWESDVSSGLRKLEETWRLRREQAWWRQPRPSPQDQVLWIHAASGEFEYAKPVIRELQIHRPEFKILVTYFSPTYRRQVENFPGVTWSAPLPFDQPWVWSKFLAHFRPRAVLLARTDVWPGMIEKLKVAGVPLLLFSSTFGAATARLRPLARRLTLHALSRFDEIQVVDSEDAQFLEGLASDDESALKLPVRVAGDTRYDQVLARLASPKALPPAWRQSRSWIVGSAWPEDLEVVGPAWASMPGTRPRLVIVPHETSPKFCQQIVEQATSSWGAKRVALASAIRDLPQADLDVLVVDQVGYLAELYSDAWVATVGGSFRRSVHSVMEPLAAGAFCVLGPHHLNNREAIAFQKIFAPGAESPQAAVHVVTDVESCRSVVMKLFAQLEQHPEWRGWLIAQVRARTGATQAVLSWLRRI